MNTQTGVVLDMMDRLSLKQYNACALVEGYWDSLKTESRLPLRSQIDPRGIEDALNYAFILESIGAGHARVRIAGMHLNELMGMEVRGMPISSFISPASREAFARVLVGVLKGPAKMQLSLHADHAQSPLEARMLLLPLQDDAGEVNRILGCLETKGPVGAAPLRFSLNDVKKTALERLPSPLHQDADPVPPALPKTAPGFAEGNAIYESPAKRPAYLKLVKNDE